jgi:hypothetical protein
MNTTSGSVSAPARSGVAAKPSRATADIELRLNPMYAWIVIGAGVAFLLVGLFILASQSKHRNPGVGVLICVISIAAIIGGNYFRHHLPVMARMTKRQLSLPGTWPRRLVIDWTNIAAIDKKTVMLFRHGVRQEAELVCIKLKNPPAATDPLSQAYPAYKRFNEALQKGVKALVGGYDVIINPLDNFMRTADWFIAECKKRMPEDSA